MVWGQGTVLPLNPCPSLSEQSEEDIDVLAFGKQQPKNIANPLYETSAPAPPESSCDPFTVSLHFTLGVRNAAFQQTLGELPRGKSSLLECVSDSKPGSHFSVRNAHLSGDGTSLKPEAACPPLYGGWGRGSKPAESPIRSHALISAWAESVLLGQLPLLKVFTR